MSWSERPGTIPTLGMSCGWDELWGAGQDKIQGIVFPCWLQHHLFQTIVVYHVQEVFVELAGWAPSLEWRCLPVPTWKVEVSSYK